MPPDRGRLAADRYIAGVLQGDRVILAKAITLIESTRPRDAGMSAELLDAILPHTGNSRRVGITGVPGAGKSTFIDTLGMHLARDRGERLAVLTVDPSSPISGGSILGDKTRMERLALEERAFIRPSPAGKHSGGVARRTRETILLCEAAGYNNIFVETVGVGQSETAIHSMTDFFLLLALAGAGDELQLMKRGILEMVDAVAINKADGENRAPAERTRAEYAAWVRTVVTCSARQGENIAAIWDLVLDGLCRMEANGELAARRRRQALAWMQELVAIGLEESFCRHPAVSPRIPELRDAVSAHRTTPFAAARELLKLFRSEENSRESSSYATSVSHPDGR